MEGNFCLLSHQGNFFSFTFDSPKSVNQFLPQETQTCKCNLLVLNHLAVDFSIENVVSYAFPMWVNFPRLPLPLGKMISDIISPIRKFIFLEPHRMYNPWPHKWVCVQFDLSRNFPLEVILSFDNGRKQCHPIRYLNILNTFFHCHSSKHMIRDCPLLVKSRPQTPIPTLVSTPMDTKTPSDIPKEEGLQVIKNKGKTFASKDGMTTNQPSQLAMLDKSMLYKEQMSKALGTSQVGLVIKNASNREKCIPKSQIKSRLYHRYPMPPLEDQLVLLSQVVKGASGGKVLDQYDTIYKNMCESIEASDNFY